MRQLLIVTVLAVTSALSLTGQAKQSRAAPLPGSSWESIKRLPDWSGVWINQSNRRHMVGEGKAPYKDIDMPFNEKGAAKFAQLKSFNDNDVYFPSRMERCVPIGIPGNIEEMSTWQILFTPGQVTMVGLQSTRKIYTDGRAHGSPSVTMFREGANDTNTGDSIGHWEGSTLVVDTIGLDPNNEIIIGLKQGRGVHVAERIHREANQLFDDVTVTAPDILAKPWTYRAIYEHSDLRLQDYPCSDNRISIDEKTGRPKFDISLPED